MNTNKARGRMPRTTPRNVGSTLLTMLIVIGAVFAACPAQAEEPNPQPTNGAQIQVVVREAQPSPTASNPAPTSTPTPTGSTQAPLGSSGSTTQSSTGSGTGSTSSTTRTTQSVGTAGTASSGAGGQSSATPVADEVSLGGTLFVSGVKAVYRPTPNPIGGRVELSFTVRNISDSPISATAVFSLRTPFGSNIGDESSVRIDALAPNESRMVSTSVFGPSLWPLSEGAFTLTPDAAADGSQLPSITRTSVVFALVWFYALVLAAAVLTVAILWVLERMRNPVTVAAA